MQIVRKPFLTVGTALATVDFCLSFKATFLTGGRMIWGIGRRMSKC